MTKGELRAELANRLGFSQSAADLVQLDLFNSWLERAQENIISEFGSQLAGTTYPPTPFIEDTDTASVPTTALLTRATIAGKNHYGMPANYELEVWQNYERGARGFVG